MERTLKLSLLTCCLLLANVNPAFSQNEADSLTKMEWFSNAKLGIFIHWGIYAVNGIDESWSFYNGYISHEDYLKQTEGFGAENYNPKEWAKLIKESGARYAVITSKHHDGFALWDTEYGNLNAVNNAKVGRDLLSPFVKAVRKEGLKLGMYYSLPDWSSELYTHFTNSEIRYKVEDDPERWAKFKTYYQSQLNELSKAYRPDLWWFDGDWEHSAEEWEAAKVRASLLADNPKTIINSRLKDHGDYGTPEQGVPLTKPKDTFWELCMTMNDSWGFQHNDHNYKTANQIIRIFIDCLKMGGNLLLDIGPRADGTIPEEQKQVLKELGRWTEKHQEAIYGSQAGISTDYYYGPTTLSADRKTLYLFVPHKPNGPLVVRGLKNKVNRIRVVGNGTKLSQQIHNKPYWSAKPGLLYIDVPESVLDEQVTVIALLLDSEIEMEER
ncbi:alpha-L-fucosidase [Roseivirga sp.]|uniref:alpha-L-fucosidase n=1 Tax=Roseivirga sp. TaxID=1964215 RepID=UPI003B527D7F